MAGKRVDIIASIGAQDNTAAAFNQVGQHVQAMQNAANKGGRQVNDSFRMMRGGAAQFGFQIQDIAVQLQGGQNPLMVLGQQGSQIASLFGTGGAVAGAIVAVGAALGTAMMPALFGTEKALADVDEQLSKVRQNMKLTADGSGVLTSELEELQAVSTELAKTALLRSYNSALLAVTVSQEELTEQTEGFSKAMAIFRTAQPIKDLQKEYDLTREKAEQLYDASRQIAIGDRAAGFVAMKNVLVDLIDPASGVNAEFRAMADEVLSTFSQFEQATASVDELQQMLARLDAGQALTTESTVKAVEAVNEQVEALRREAEMLGMTERAQALYTAAKQNALPTQIAEINAAYDRIEAYEAEQEALKEHAKFTADLQVEREAIRRKQYEADLRAYDEAQALLQREQESLLVGTDAINAEYDKRVDAVREALATIGAEKERYAELEKGLEAERAAEILKYQEDLAQKEALLYQARFQAASQLAGAMSGIFRDGTKEQRAFLAIQKGLAVGEAIMNMHRAISNANAVPWPANALAIAQASATGLGAVAGIRAASFEGGGYTGNGARVGGLDGKGGRLAIMHPNEKVIDMEKGGGESVNVNFTIVANDASGFDKLLQSRRGTIISMIQQASREGGRRSPV